MTTTVEAIYEKGTLRLDKPISLPDGTRVEVVVITRDAVAQKEERIRLARSAEGKTTAQIVAEIAALPLEGRRDAFSGRDHDKVLYGKR